MQSISVFLSPDTSCMKKTDYMYFELNSPTALQMQAELAGLMLELHYPDNIVNGLIRIIFIYAINCNTKSRNQ